MDGVDGVGRGGLREALLYATFGAAHRRRSFSYAGERYRYHAARYNATWANERTVELPIALRLMSRYAGGRTLEVGNVLRHYVDERHDVVDKYEQATGVRNVDVLDFRPTQPYDLIVSISTFEHIGWDEDRDAGKPARALEHLATMLAPGGTLLVTFPLGYNPTIDDALAACSLHFDRVGFLRRISRDNRWRETIAATCRDARYDAPFPQGNVIAVGIRDAPT
jgi:hypothetical protein